MIDDCVFYNIHNDGVISLTMLNKKILNEQKISGNTNQAKNMENQGFFKTPKQSENTSIENFTEILFKLINEDCYEFSIERNIELKKITVKFTSEENDLFAPEEVENKLRLLGKHFRDILIQKEFIGKNKSCRCKMQLSKKTLVICESDEKNIDIIFGLLNTAKEQ